MPGRSTQREGAKPRALSEGALPSRAGDLRTPVFGAEVDGISRQVRSLLCESGEDAKEFHLSPASFHFSNNQVVRPAPL